MGTRSSFSSPELTRQVRRLVAARLFLYLGAMSSYFIGVMGTLTFAMGAGVGDNAIAVALLNMCMVAGQIKGGSLLDRVGPQHYFRMAAAGLITSGLLYQVLGTSIVGVYVGVAVFGLAWGISDIIPRAFPAYLTGEMDELKRVNSLLTLVNNVATVVGPLVGGAIALVAPTQTVFLFMVACTALACVPGLGLRALRVPASEGAQAQTEGIESPEWIGGGGAGGVATDQSSDQPKGSVAAGFATIFGSSVLTLLFWATLLSFMGYGAFDPLESLFYRDVLNVGAEWMGWLSALSGVGGLIGAALAGIMPTRLINVRSMLVVLFITGVGSLLYVSTPFVAVACVGQFTLGVAFAAFGPISNTLVQVHAPLDQVGRVNAAMGAGYNLAGAIPLLCAPALAHVFGVQGTLVAAGVAVALAPLIILATRRQELADLVRAEQAAEKRE